MNRVKGKAVKRILILIFIIMLLSLTSPIKNSAIYGIKSEIMSIDSIIDPNYTIDAIPFPESRPIRVAIYDEQNMTAPSYDNSLGINNNNVSHLVNILSTNEQIDITIVTAQDIFNRVLNTANFDVFAMIDNNPREYITDMVNDFWLAGGGIIAFDGSAAFLGYFGILPPEAAGTSGVLVYWNYGADNYKIANRHPVSKAFALDTNIISPSSYAYCAWDWSALSGSVIASDLIPIAHSTSSTNDITILALDPTDRGGKVVSVCFDLVNDEIPSLDQLIRDAVDWLAPQPKAKIAFDMSHKPHSSIDSWDTYSHYPGRYEIMRNLLVSHGYTVDKLFDVPSGDNFTIERLNKYDMLMCISPDINYTAGDLTAMEEWVADGGSLLAVGDNPIFNNIKGADQINSLVNPFEMSIVKGVLTIRTFTEFTKHPTTEGVSFLRQVFFGYINITGSAVPICSDDPLTNIVVASNEHGEGRVILSSDITWFQDSYIAEDDNEQFILNLANWLSAATADVLIYVDWNMSPNYYKTPVTLALNDLGINYYLTSRYESVAHDYFNMSLCKYDWDLVIIDNPTRYGLGNYLDDVENYVDSGGKLIMSYYDVDNIDTHSLWGKLGFEHVSDFTDQPPLFIWDATHPIFNQPFDYNAANFVYGISVMDDGDRLTVLSNGIPLAGLTATETSDEAIIVLRDDEQSLFNSYLIDEFTGDIDDSTYADNFELWKNEIAFMMRPKLEFNMTIPTKASTIDTLQVNVNITNHGHTEASLGFIDITIPIGLGNTTDDLSDVFTILDGETHTATWTIEIEDVGDYTINFESSYQWYLGTFYSVTFGQEITISFLPWYIYVAAGAGLLLLIILIITIAIVIKKKKKASS